MNEFSPDWPQSATHLLEQAKQACANGGGLIKLILTGNSQVDSWLIENQLLGFLLEKNIRPLRFELTVSNQDKRYAALVPLPDGTAFAHCASGQWWALERAEATHEIQYIGFRYAPSDRWLDGFRATLHGPDGVAVAVTPSEVAKLWEEITGSRPLGYALGVIDQIQAFGFDVIDKVFNTQGRLGL